MFAARPDEYKQYFKLVLQCEAGCFKKQPIMSNELNIFKIQILQTHNTTPLLLKLICNNTICMSSFLKVTLSRNQHFHPPLPSPADGLVRLRNVFVIRFKRC